ncbi:MAG: hypothetical protein LQ342_006063 [Letrouitia transgressa]|nr:MAG: hypothetical protein LQ342_006063 [Letrouitia transgressa]
MSELRGSWDGDHSLFADPEERRVLFAALDSLRQYRKTAHFNVTHRRRQNFYALPTAQWQMLAAQPFNILSNLEKVDDAIDSNADMACEILATGLASFGLSMEPQNAALNWRNAATAADVDKARTTIRQFYRDWSLEGANEREASYGPVMSDISEAYKDVDDRGAVKILIPGAGLGRLVFELCRMGYSVEGNEISYHQLIASNWVLNHTDRANQFQLYPFAFEFSNVISRENQLKCVGVPDIHPAKALDEASSGMRTHAFDRMNMTAADFIVFYGDAANQETFDAVATVFFIDTAPNVIRYIEVLHKCLKVGGLWTNVGPLLWHGMERKPAQRESRSELENVPKEIGIEQPGGVELSEEEVILLVERMGFRIEKHEIKAEGTGYIGNTDSMLQNVYRTAHWVARKI